MLNAIRYAREKKVPYFGICLGMQTACIEFARNVCGLKDANSSEFDPGHASTASSTSCANCWAWKRWAGRCAWARGPACCSRIRWPPKAYGGATEISERHRHRYEFNREYEALLTGAGLRISGSTPDQTYVEIVEIPGHPYFLGCQFHPEFKSKPLEPHPLFLEFVKASYNNRVNRGAESMSSTTTVQ